MSCCILYTVLLVVILLFIIVIIWFYYVKYRPKQKNIISLTISMEKNNEFRRGGIKNCTCYYFDDIINTKDLANFLLDEESYQNVLIYDVLYETLCTMWCKTFTYYMWASVLEIMMELNI